LPLQVLDDRQPVHDHQPLYGVRVIEAVRKATSAPGYHPQQ